MDSAKLRAWWSHRQGLDGSVPASSPEQVLSATGWARSVGGAGPYLGLFARAALSRATVDVSVSALQIHELPSARGCTYVLPSCDFELGLRAAQACWGADLKTVMKLGVTEAEIDKLCEAVLGALSGGPLDPEQIKEAVGPAARSLGSEGAKKGTSNTMPVALGRLQVSGDIRRVPVNGRLDQQRYRYTLWRPNPLAKSAMSPEETNVELARRYFRWIGPATLSEFQWFSGLGAKAAKKSVELLRLVGLDSGGRLMTAEDREAFEQFRIPEDPYYVLTAALDGIVLLRRGHADLMADEDRGRSVLSGSGTAALGAIADLPSHAILDRGRLVGQWEYDTRSESIAWWSFVKPDRDLEQAIARTEEYVRSQLGDARSFSLDSPKSRVSRIERLRSAQAQ